MKALTPSPADAHLSREIAEHLREAGKIATPTAITRLLPLVRANMERLGGLREALHHIAMTLATDEDSGNR